MLRLKAMRACVTLLLLTFFAACTEEPLPPVEGRWVKIADFPPNIKEVASIDCNGRGIYAVGEDTEIDKHVVMSYVNGAFSTDFIIPEEFRRGCFADVSTHNRGGWVVGGKYESGKVRPLLINYNTYEHTWEEINLNGVPDGILSTIINISAEESWLLLDQSWYAGDHDGFLIKYANGSAYVYPEFGALTAVYTESQHLPRTLFAATYVPKGGEVEGSIKIYITTDCGASWVVETLPPRLVNGREIIAAYARGYYGPAVYFSVRFADGALGIVKRKGPPGRGVYEPVFIAYSGPYFHDLNSIAFRDPHSQPYGVSVDGVAVGIETTVVFDEGSVCLERLPYPMELNSATRANGNGFFAVGRNLTFHDYELLFHP